MNVIAARRRSAPARSGPSSEAIAEWAGRRTRQNQECLLQDIATVTDQSLATIAERLGLTIDEVREALSGEMDLTMTELRLLTIASEVTVSFQVRSARRDYNTMLHAISGWGRPHTELDARHEAPLSPHEFGRRVVAAER